MSVLEWVVLLALLVDMVLRVLAVIVVPRNRRPTSAMAWLLAIFFLPVPGLLLFLLIGSPKTSRRRRRKQAEIDSYLHQASEELRVGTFRDNPPPWFDQVVAMNQHLGALPLTGDNSAHLIPGYQDSLDAMAAAMAVAEQYIHVEFYILQSDSSTEPFFAAMEQAAQRGVQVRVLLDHWANRFKPRYQQTISRLDAMGADWHLMLPVRPFRGQWERPDLRNHRKLVVVDGIVGFIGSQNVTKRDYNLPKNIKRGLQWVDLMARVEGPVVAEIDAVFYSDWYTESGETLVEELTPTPVASSDGDLDCQIVPSGPGYEFENNLQLFLSLMFHAKEQMIIISPYFVPDESLLRAITNARHRGVHVELFVSETGDQAGVYHAQRSFYEAMLRIGVRIYMYRSPYILHTKTLRIDSEIAVIGSSNMDMRSFGLDAEISMLVRGEEFCDELRQVEDHYRSLSKELTLQEWLKQPLRATALDNLARLTSALQ
ncbi:MAG: cardiolipin synthase [Beutenbergiaceae bacterium]